MLDPLYGSHEATTSRLPVEETDVAFLGLFYCVSQFSLT